jgi:preprotein translocase subunit YajC
MSLISTAFAAETAATTATHPNQTMNMVLMLVVFGAFIYFFLWRPQMKRQKQHKNMVSSVKQGDEVLTNGGLMGKISKIEETYFVLMIAKETEIMLQKSALGGVLPKGTIKGL